MGEDAPQACPELIAETICCGPGRASMDGHTVVAEALLAAGANPNLAATDGSKAVRGVRHRASHARC